MDEKRIIEYTTPEQQIQMLKDKGLSFGDEENAKIALAEYGYYNIINSYKTPYIEIKNGEKTYISGTTFEQIHSLFILDHNLRNSTMAAMLDLEEHLRAAAAEVIADSFGTDHNKYLQWKNYRDRSVAHNRFSLRGILSTLNQNITSGKDPIKYYRENYGIVPPWILLKGTYFSTLVNFIRLFKDAEKQKIIQKLYNLDEESCTLSCVKEFLSSTLFMCLDYRNRAAHGGRIYNYIPKNCNDIMSNNELFDYFPRLKDLSEFHGISLLLRLLYTFDFDGPAEIIHDTLLTEINRHLSHYPQDQKYIEDTIGMELVKEHFVFVAENSTKYHQIPSCSGIKNPKQVALKDLDRSVYTPCKRCYK